MSIALYTAVIVLAFLSFILYLANLHNKSIDTLEASIASKTSEYFCAGFDAGRAFEQEDALARNCPPSKTI